MKEKSYKIFWNGNFVGEMLEPNFDMFETYGKWKPAITSATDEFLKALRDGEQLSVNLDNPDSEYGGIVDFFPNEEIQIKSYPNFD